MIISYSPLYEMSHDSKARLFVYGCFFINIYYIRDLMQKKSREQFIPSICIIFPEIQYSCQRTDVLYEKCR